MWLMIAVPPYLKQALIIKLLNRPLRHSRHCLIRLGKTDKTGLSARQFVDPQAFQSSQQAHFSNLISISE
jgi:hypothetical protein